MNAAQISVVIYSSLGLVALWFMIFVCWRQYTIDRFRQKLFDLRADLFDYALTGEVSFNAHEYIRLRNVLNSMIRFAHEVSFVRLAGAVVWERFNPVIATLPGFTEELKSSDLPPRVKQKLKETHSRLGVLLTGQIITTSLTAMPCIFLYSIYLSLRYGGSVKTPVPTPAEQIVADGRFDHHIRLIEQQAVDTREMQLQELAATR